MGCLDYGEFFYSFSLDPKNYQPSGATNFSVITNSSIVMKMNENLKNILINNPNLEMKCELWGCGQKILRIMSGLCGLAFT